MSYRWSPLARRGTVRATLLLASGLLALAGSLISAGSVQASTLPALTLTINPSSIAVGGALESGAVNVVASATGIKEPQAILFQLKPGVSLAEVSAFLNTPGKKDVNSTSKFGSIVLDVEARTGAGSETQTYLQPGQYVALAGSGEGRPTKLRASFTVASAKSPSPLPTPQATVRAIEFGFTGPSVLHEGELVRFENEGFVVHMAVALQVKTMAAAKQVVKLMLAGKERQAGRLGIGGVNFAGPLSSGAYQQETISAKPGIYVLACFMETQDGRSHTRLGMERIIRIVR